jgi:hypothetical protein
LHALLARARRRRRSSRGSFPPVGNRRTIRQG